MESTNFIILASENLGSMLLTPLEMKGLERKIILSSLYSTQAH